MKNSCSIAIVIPSYNRTNELSELLDSVLNQETFPDEVIVCEDHSPERLSIEKLVSSYRNRMNEKGINLIYEDNELNLGYDKNLRKSIELGKSTWALIMGNDDLLLPEAISEIKKFLAQHNGVNFISRTFLRFNNDINSPLGVSRLSERDEVYNISNSQPNIIFRTAGFVGGLVVNVPFAKEKSSDIFDGSLYYQIYLAAVAYCEGGIGYISTPIVGGRADNPPMFGNSSDDKESHIPGSYTAKGRAAMWRGVLSIAEHVGKKYDIDLSHSLQRELMIRQSFHVFEMNAGQSVKTNLELRKELGKLGLMQHYVPWSFLLLNCLLHKQARNVYKIIRKFMQR